jgi:hypothetical protein
VQPDSTPPQVIDRIPSPGGTAVAGFDATVSVTFSEPLAALSVQAQALSLAHAGPDGRLGTGDDVPLAVTSVIYRPELQLAVWGLGEAMPPGAMRATLQPALRDAAGNALVPVSWDFNAYEGLSMRMFSTWSPTLVESFFEGAAAEEFTEYRAGTGAVPRTVAVVPNVHFPGGDGPWLLHAGADGSYVTSNRLAPQGDDITFVSPRQRDGFALVLLGTLNLPEAGEFTFQVDIDDQFVLEIDGQRLMGVSSGCQVASYRTNPVSLAAGNHRFRMVAVDQCTCCVVAVLKAWGPGLPGGVVPAERFGR